MDLGVSGYHLGLLKYANELSRVRELIVKASEVRSKEALKEVFQIVVPTIRKHNFTLRDRQEQRAATPVPTVFENNEKMLKDWVTQLEPVKEVPKKAEPVAETPTQPSLGISLLGGTTEAVHENTPPPPGPNRETTQQLERPTKRSQISKMAKSKVVAHLEAANIAFDPKATCRKLQDTLKNHLFGEGVKK